MKKLLLILFCMPLLMATTCEEDPLNDQIVCTEQFVYGLNVTVKDVQTNQILTDGVLVTAVEGSYTENLALISVGNSFLGAGERPGNYIITVTKVGYQTYTSGTITLTADVCHVLPQQIEVNLNPL
jgi:hypothetical protein